ncbi:MAG: hypothetical protein A2Z34_08575 [Planctomycetes bacterium RBG_16_59_8]|nr:MAG: hypothetical protein A2Z34_08575 [Planctomycetes bacterium RBG_16_59_8]
MKAMILVILAGLFLLLSGCIRDDGSGIWQSWKRHFQHHLLVAHHQTVEMHREADWLFFDLDERDPDDY